MLLSLKHHFIKATALSFALNIFRITMTFKQLFFSFLNLSTSFCKLYSSGQLLANHIKKFKFFKKSIFNTNPLVFLLRYNFTSFFSVIYFLECLNYSKRQYLFLKKLITSVKMKIKFLIMKKTSIYTTKPVKRIKRRILRLIKNT